MIVPAALRDQRKRERIAQLEKLVAAFKQDVFGRRSNKGDPYQFKLTLKELETGIAAVDAEEEVEVCAARRLTQGAAPIVVRSRGICRGSGRL